MKKHTVTSKKQTKNLPKRVKSAVRPESSDQPEGGIALSAMLTAWNEKNRVSKSFLKKIDKVIEKQAKFFDTVVLTSLLLKVYRGNPSEFRCLIGDDVAARYNWEECKENPDYVWEFIDEISCAVVYSEKKFKMRHTGLFCGLCFAKRGEKPSTLEEIMKAYEPYSKGEWSI